MEEQTKTDYRPTFTIGDIVRPIGDDGGLIDVRPCEVIRLYDGDEKPQRIEYRYLSGTLTTGFAIDAYSPPGCALSSDFTIDCDALKRAVWTENPLRFLRETGAIALADAERIPTLAELPDHVAPKTDTVAQRSAIEITARLSAIDTILVSFNDDCTHILPLDVVRFLEAVAEHLHVVDGWQHRGPEWIRCGPIVVPSTSTGIAALRKLRDSALAVRSNGTDNMGIDDASTLAKLISALKSAAIDSAILSPGLRNVTKEDNRCLVFDAQLCTATMREMPTGTKVPQSLLGASLEGIEVDEDDINSMANSNGWCADGVRDWLQQWTDAEFEGGDYDCDQCGSTVEDYGTLASVSFTLTPEIIDELDCSEGYLDVFQDYFEAEGSGSCDFSTLLQEKNDSEILEGWKPADKITVTAKGIVGGKEFTHDVETETGIEYDPDVWRFSADYSELELDDLDSEELIRLIPLLAEINAQYRDRSILPPIPGTLERVTITNVSTYYGRYRAGSADMIWDPTDGTLSHVAIGGGSGVRLEIDPVSDRVALIVGLSADDRVTVGTDGRIEVPSGALHVGADCALWMRLSQSTPSL